MVEPGIYEGEKCAGRKNAAQGAIDGAHDFHGEIQRAGVFGGQRLQRRGPERGRQIVPAGVCHQIVHDASARRNHIVEVSARPRAPGGWKPENALPGRSSGRGIRVLLGAGQLLDAFGLKFGEPFISPFEPQMRAHPGNDLSPGDRLGDVVHPADLKSLDLGGRVFVGGDKENWRRKRPRLQCSACGIRRSRSHPAN